MVYLQFISRTSLHDSAHSYPRGWLIKLLRAASRTFCKSEGCDSNFLQCFANVPAPPAPQVRLASHLGRTVYHTAVMYDPSRLRHSSLPQKLTVLQLII
jgi:hypothetical protein